MRAEPMMPQPSLPIEMEVSCGEVALPGTLTMPAGCCGLVIFVHGSGSSRHSSRNRFVAGQLVERGCATLLFDLLTGPEAEDRRNVFDIPMLARRVLEATRSLWKRSDLAVMPAGYFGASTGAAAALVAAAELGPDIAAVVSRGGRPDLADVALPRVMAPTLLLVGSLDEHVLELNRMAQRKLRCPNRLVVVPEAGHLFEEPAALERVAGHAGDWFTESFNAWHKPAA
jgi:putative phosphoribosyl transferase